MKDKVELNSLPLEDKRPQRSQMAMNSDLTREQFKAREIETPEPSTEQVMADNAKMLATVQAQYRAMTVKGRKKQRDKLRAKMGLDGKPTPPRVRFVPVSPQRAAEEIVEDKLYSVGKHDRAE